MKFLLSILWNHFNVCSKQCYYFYQLFEIKNFIGFYSYCCCFIAQTSFIVILFMYKFSKKKATKNRIRCVVFKYCIQRKIYYMQSKNILVVFLFMYFVLWLFRKIFFFGTFCCCEEPIRFDV